MMNEAQMHAKEDEKAKDLSQKRNDADSLIYAVETSLTDFGALIGDTTKSKAQMQIESLKKQMKENADLASLTSSFDELQKTMMEIQQEAQSKSQGQAPGAEAKEPVGASATNGGRAKQSGSNDDVIDAEVV